MSGTIPLPRLELVDPALANHAPWRRAVGDASRATGNARKATRRQLLSDTTPMRGVGLVRPSEILGGKFRVGAVLGRGGMSVVYEAEHVHLKQQVAVKVLFPRPGSAVAFDDALHEAKAVARLSSEHVVRVMDVGLTSFGHAYLVMERLRGIDVSERLRSRGPLPYTSAVRIVLQACRGLAEAHAAGIVHGDIKPSNLFLAERPDGAACVKVLDFGLSENTAREQYDGVTYRGGSPGYASPEQLDPQCELDPRVDVWGIGATLYKLITGRKPFAAKNLQETLIAALHTPIAPMASPHGLVPLGLEAIVMRCLEINRDYRYPSVLALAEALMQYTSELGENDEPILPGYELTVHDFPIAELDLAALDRREISASGPYLAVAEADFPVFESPTFGGGGPVSPAFGGGGLESASVPRVTAEPAMVIAQTAWADAKRTADGDATLRIAPARRPLPFVLIGFVAGMLVALLLIAWPWTPGMVEAASAAAAHPNAGGAHAPAKP